MNKPPRKDEMKNIIGDALESFNWRNSALPGCVADFIAGKQKVDWGERIHISQHSELRSELEREKASNLDLKNKLKEAQSAFDDLYSREQDANFRATVAEGRADRAEGRADRAELMIQSIKEAMR